MSSPIDIFWNKVQKIDGLLVETGDYKSVTPLLRKIVDLVRSNPSAMDAFEAAFIEIIKNPDKHSLLVVTYCMHALRLPNIRRHVEERMRRDPLRLDMHARHVLEAYSSDWILAPIFEE